MRRNDESRAENYIARRKRYRKWGIAISVLSVCVAITTLYLLNKPATAVSETAASAIGMVLPQDDAGDETQDTPVQESEQPAADKDQNTEAAEQVDVNTQTQNDNDLQAGNIAIVSVSGVSSEASSAASGSSGTDSAADSAASASTQNTKAQNTNENEIKLTASYVDSDDQTIREDSDLQFDDKLDLTAAPAEIDGYQYEKALIDGKEVKSIRKITSSDEAQAGSAADEASSSDSEALSYLYTTTDDQNITVSADITVKFVYTASKDEQQKAISLKATLVDEFGTEIDPAKYTGIDLPQFGSDGTLHLDDAANPPYADITVKTGLLKVVKYTYDKTTLDENVITAIKRVALSDVDESGADASADYVAENTATAATFVSDASDSDISSLTDSADKEENLKYNYYYTTDGTAWTPFTEDTVLHMTYADRKKTSYAYEDDSIKVTATLQKANAIPDDAELIVTPVTKESKDFNYDAYMQALNNHADEIAQQADIDVMNYSEDNTLLYDISFISNNQKIEPADGSVAVSVQFKKKQLSDGLNIENAEDLTIIHLPVAENAVSDAASTFTFDDVIDESNLTAKDLSVDVLKDAAVTVTDTQEATFDLNSFSTICFVDSNNNIVNGIKPGKSYTYEDILGNAKYFGIVANTFSPTGDIDSNFAVKRITSSNSATAGNYTGNNNPGIWLAGDASADYTCSKGTVWCSPNAYKYITVNNGKKVITEETAIDAYIDDLYKNIKEMSNILYSENSYGIENQSFDGGQDAVLDISNEEDGTYYINGDKLFAKGNAGIQIGRLKIRKKSKQTIVFNISLSDVYLQNFVVYNTDTGNIEVSSAKDNATADEYARTFIFNMPHATSVSISSAVFGIFIAPQATLQDLKGNGTGWIILDKFQNGSEWHCVWQDMPTEDKIPVPASIRISAKKEINGNDATDSVSEKFKFNLQEYKDGFWTTIQTATNEASNIQFDNMEYTKEGKYQYRIIEDQDSAIKAGYYYDATNYCAEVTVKSTQQNTGSRTTVYYIASVQYYKNKLCNKVPEVIFNNNPIPSTYVTVQKNWDDFSNKYDTRWSQLEIKLKAKTYSGAQTDAVDIYGNTVQPYIMTTKDAVQGNTDQWKYTFSNLPVKTPGGYNIVYSVHEYWVQMNSNNNIIEEDEVCGGHQYQGYYSTISISDGNATNCCTQNPKLFILTNKLYTSSLNV
ncbi:MAG: Cna B-type domain-containing protein, partial [Butyrivibrio sp.]|nr:Cna B-type domain-containing protein [Butyrivibrio sp.]